MAAAKTARLVAREALNADTALLRFAADEPFSFVGGQYVIVSTGIPLGDPAEGKTVKRAYSVLSTDTDDRSFEIALRRIGDGAGSNYMLGLSEGATLQFSGPWGKYLPAAEQNDDPAVVIATDTGISVALGLLRGQAFQPRLKRTRVYWLVASDEYFVPESFVRERLPAECGSFKRIVVPAERLAREKWLMQEQAGLLQEIFEDTPKALYLSGDGFLLAALRNAASERGDDAPRLMVESFFHHQELKTELKKDVQIAPKAAMLTA